MHGEIVYFTFFNEYNKLRWYGTHVNINAKKKVHFNQNAFTDLEFLNFTTYDQKLCIINIWKSKNYKSPIRIQTRLTDSCLMFYPLR